METKFYIFLDVDGVLNNEKTYDEGYRTPDGFCGVDPINLKALASLVNQTNGVLILSSDWRIKDIYDDEDPVHMIYLREQLAEYGMKLEGFTPDNGKRNHRGSEIAASIKTHHIKNYVILDDERFSDFGQFGNHFYKVDWHTGLTMEDVNKIVNEEVK